MTKNKKALLGGVIAVLLVVTGVTAYIQGKQYTTKQEVKKHLETEGYASDIVVLDSFVANLSGDKNWMVEVESQSTPGHYYYYYDRAKEKVILESYILDGEEFDAPPETATRK